MFFHSDVDDFAVGLEDPDLSAVAKDLEPDAVRALLRGL
jgi:hypothetical protein